MFRRSVIGVGFVVGGFTFGFLFGGGNSKTPTDHNTPPPKVVVIQPPEVSPLTEQQQHSSVFSDGSYHYNDNTASALIFKVVDKDSHTICYTAENKYYNNNVSISCVKDDSVEDTKDKKEEPKKDTSVKDKHD